MSRRQPTRTCVGCRSPGTPDELVRWIVGSDGVPKPDLERRAKGRGAWTHPDQPCLKRAVPGFSRSLRRRVRADSGELMDRLSAAAERIFLQKLTACVRDRLLAGGTASCRRELSSSEFKLLLVATDAVGVLSEAWVDAAIARGAALAWGTKKTLGRLMGRSELELAVVLDESRSVALSRLHRVGRLRRVAAQRQV